MSQIDNQTLLTVKAAAQRLEIPTWKLQRAVKRGLIPHYTILNKRKLVRMDDIFAFIERSRVGGAQ